MTIALRQRPLARVVAGIVRANDGALFDPSDMTTLYQDAAGTTPVTAVEQPVGLVLDKSQGLMLGPELVSNGTFDANTTGWTTNKASIAAVNGELAVTNTAGEPDEQAEYDLTGLVTPNTFYKITFSGRPGSATQPAIFLLETEAISIGQIGVTYQNKYSTILKVPASFGKVTARFRTQGAAGGVSYFDNISIKELYGYHATQSITASRPTLSARYNLLTKTEDFADAVWLKQAAGVGAVPVVTPNYGIAPNGEQTADRLIFNLNGGLTSGDYSRLVQPVTSVANTSHESSFYARTLDGSTVTMKFSINGYPTQTITITPAWSRISIFGSRVDTTYSFILDLRGTFGTSNYADILLWGANTRIGTSPGPYQRVNTATDYDTDERYFPKYLRFDGIDDYLNLPYMGLYGGGAASIICARDAVSQTTDTYIISERSATDADPKYFPSRQLASAGNMDAYIVDDNGAVVLDTIGSPFSGVANAVIRSIVDSGNNLKLFKNGTLAANDNYTRSGTLTLNNTTIGASVSTTTSNYASMKLYGLIVTKSALTDAQRIACERYTGRKAGVIL